MLCVNSEEYHPTVEHFNSWETVNTLFANSNAVEDMNVLIKETGHLFQTDLLSLAPLEHKMWTEMNPSNEVVELYELGNKVVMDWLSKTGFGGIHITAHTQVSPYYEKSMVKVLGDGVTHETKEGEGEDSDADNNASVNDTQDGLVKK